MRLSLDEGPEIAVSCSFPQHDSVIPFRSESVFFAHSRLNWSNTSLESWLCLCKLNNGHFAFLLKELQAAAMNITFDSAELASWAVKGQNFNWRAK